VRPSCAGGKPVDKTVTAAAAVRRSPGPDPKLETPRRRRGGRGRRRGNAAGRAKGAARKRAPAKSAKPAPGTPGVDEVK